MESVWPVAIVVVIVFIGVLDLCKPSTAVVLRTTTTLLVAEVLAGSRSEKSYKLDQSSCQMPAFLLLTNMLGIFDAPPKFRLIVWWWEQLFLTNVWSSTSAKELHIISDSLALGVNMTVVYLWTEFRILKHD